MIAESIAKALGWHRAGATWMARCPAHEDRKPNLSISSSRGGKVLVRCHAGCGQRDVIAILRQRGFWETTRKSWGRFARKRQDRVSDEPDAYAVKRSEVGHKPRGPLRANLTNALIAPAPRSARFGFARRPNARCGHSGQTNTLGGARREKPRLLTRIPREQTALRGRGVAAMLIRHPDSARGNDLYETPEVATLALLVRFATDIEIEQLEIIEGGTLNAPPARKLFAVVKSISSRTRMRAYAIAPGNIQTDGFGEADCQMIFEAVVPARAREIENLRFVLEMQDHGGAA